MDLSINTYLDRIFCCLCHLGARGVVLCTRPPACKSLALSISQHIKSFKCPTLEICCCSKYPRLGLVHAMKFPSPQGTTIVKTPVIARPPPPPPLGLNIGSCIMDTSQHDPVW